MSETNISTKSKKFHHLNEFQRGKIEVLLKMKISKAEIARQIGISRSTLYEELKRGTVTQMKNDLTYCKKYFSDVGQRVYKIRRKNCRKPYKISQVEDFMNFAEEQILKEKWSPDSVCDYAILHNLFEKIQAHLKANRFPLFQIKQ